jgi:hypothetical protein
MGIELVFFVGSGNTLFALAVLSLHSGRATRARRLVPSLGMDRELCKRRLGLNLGRSSLLSALALTTYFS